MKNNKKVAAFALVLVAAFLLAGIGYAYTSTTTTTGNTITSEDILIEPGVIDDNDEFQATYVGTANAVDYDTELVYDSDSASSSKLYGIEMNLVDNVDKGQNLTNITTLRITNEGSEAKTLSAIKVIIDAPALLAQFKEGGAYADSSNLLKMSIVDLSEASAQPIVADVSVGATSIVFTMELSKVIPAADANNNVSGYVDFGFTFVILGDIENVDEPVCSHSEVLSPAEFTMKFRAIAA
jgi:hypothetical protein